MKKNSIHIFIFINIFRKDINKVTCTLKDLKENTIYIIKAAAVTLSGTGKF